MDASNSVMLLATILGKLPMIKPDTGHIAAPRVNSAYMDCEMLERSRIRQDFQTCAQKPA